MGEFVNRPGVTLSGKTWDAFHMDKFLHSEWGEKLYKNKETGDQAVLRSQNEMWKNSIRPSATFVSEDRERKAANMIDKPLGSPLLTWTGKSVSKSPVKKNLVEISQKMHEIERKQEKTEEEYAKLMGPSKRRQIFEAEKKRLKEYKSLKNEKNLGVKNERIVKNAYPEGILGVDSPDRAELSPYYYKVQLDNEKFSKTLAVNRMNRAMYIMNKTSANPQIQFYNEKNNEVPQEKLGGIKRVEDMEFHYHDTHKALFTPYQDTNSPERAERLKNLWRGNRNFDIISGNQYQL